MNQIEYYYSAHSAFAYLGAAALYEICAAHDVTLTHRPILLSPVVEAAGGPSFASRTQPHLDYYFGREIERWAEWRSVDIVNFRPTHHDNPIDLPNGVIIAAQQAGADVDAVSLAILKAHWKHDADIADRDSLHEILAGQGVDADALLDAALSDRVQKQHSENTEAAIELPVFGSPTYVVNGDPFYGQDRLELVARALQQPFAPSAWTNTPVKG